MWRPAFRFRPTFRPAPGRHALACAGLVTVLTMAGFPALSASAAGAPDPTQAAQAPEPDPRVRGFADAWSGSARCGGHLVEWSTPRSSGEAVLTVRDESGEVVVHVTEPVEGCCERITPFWCGEALNDRRTVLSYGYYSGGAHCCTTMYVVDLKGPATLLRTELGNYNDALVATQLDDGASLELFGFSDVFAYFGDLSFAASPWLPVVFAYRNGVYREVTPNFEHVVRSDLAAALAELEAALQGPSYPADPATAALQAFGDYILLDEARAGLERLKSTLSAWGRPDVAAWLDANAAEAMRLVGERFDGVN